MLIDPIKGSGGNSLAIVCYNNQDFFKNSSCISPWKTKDYAFLLFDFVHIVKSTRNNWINEKTGEL